MLVDQKAGRMLGLIDGLGANLSIWDVKEKTGFDGGRAVKSCV